MGNTVIENLKLFNRRINSLPLGVRGFILPTEEGIEFYPAVRHTVRSAPRFMITWEALADGAAGEIFVNRHFDGYASDLADQLVFDAKLAEASRQR